MTVRQGSIVQRVHTDRRYSVVKVCASRDDKPNVYARPVAGGRVVHINKAEYVVVTK